MKFSYCLLKILRIEKKILSHFELITVNLVHKMLHGFLFQIVSTYWDFFSLIPMCTNMFHLYVIIKNTNYSSVDIVPSSFISAYFQIVPFVKLHSDLFCV